MNDLATFTAVQNAVKTGNSRLVVEFVEQGFNLNFIFWRDPLLFLAKDPQMIRTMVQNGADINLKGRQGLTPMHWAMKSPENITHVVRTIVRMGADVSLTNEYGITAMDDALYMSRVIRRGRSPHANAIADNMMLNVDAYVDEVRKLEDEEMVRHCQVAFAMGIHPRLGEGSKLRLLYPDVLRMVLERVGNSDGV